jgi:hypothetical protein
MLDGLVSTHWSIRSRISLSLGGESDQQRQPGHVGGVQLFARGRRPEVDFGKF